MRFSFNDLSRIHVFQSYHENELVDFVQQRKSIAIVETDETNAGRIINKDA